jgi:NAD(P)H-hydrate repair Nnr-like enzyme with NAD(P)H-hydrate dehydratase domain
VQWLQQALGCPLPLILDADALNLLAADTRLQNRLRQREAATIITPHPAEAARLLACTQQIFRQTGYRPHNSWPPLNAVVVLKGAGSLICAPKQPYYLNTSGGPHWRSPDKVMS